jgi:hypothetical protein
VQAAVDAEPACVGEAVASTREEIAGARVTVQADGTANLR